MKDDIQRYNLYGGDVELVFSPKSTKYRYTVNDRISGATGESVRGVTSILKDIIAKPDLMTWPMNMANAFYFGAKFDETTKEYTHDWASAAIYPSRDENGEAVEPLLAEQLHEIMLEGSRQWVKRSDSGKDIGTLVHSMVERFLKGDDTPVDTEGVDEVELKKANKAFNKFRLWWKSLPNPQVISLERPVYSRSMKYAGTFDLLMEVNGKTYLMDLKTTNASKKAPLGVYAEYFLQLGGYAHALKEEEGSRIDDLGIIRVGKDGRLAVVTAGDLNLSPEACERAFAFAVRLHDFLEQATPFLQDVHFKSHLIPSNVVEQLDSVSN